MAQAPDPVETIPEPETVVAPAEPAVVAVIVEEASEPSVKEETVPEASESTKPEITYWKETASNNGFILTHPEKEVTWVLMKSSIAEVFMAISTTRQGVAFKQPKGWRLEYYLGDLLKVEEIQLED